MVASLIFDQSFLLRRSCLQHWMLGQMILDQLVKFAHSYLQGILLISFEFEQHMD